MIGHARTCHAPLQVTALIAKVALKAVCGLDLDASEYLNALKAGIGEEVADRAFDQEDLRRMTLGEEVGMDMQRASKASYKALKAFMEKEEGRKKPARRGNGYVDFRDSMECVPDREKGMVWVSKKNAKSWI